MKSGKGVKGMTRQDIIRAAAKAAGVTQETAAAVINAALDTATAALVNGDAVKLHGIGVFETRIYKSKTMSNYLAGKCITIPERKNATFTASQTLKERLNGRRG